MLEETSRKERKYNAIEKTFEILGLFSTKHSKLSINSISSQLGFNASTVHRILSTLVEYGYVVKLDDRKYSIGTQPVYLHAIYTINNYLNQIRPLVDEIRSITGETASFFIEENNKRICLYRAHSFDEIRHHIEQGTRLNLNRGASGKIILAYGRAGNKNNTAEFMKIRHDGYYSGINEHNPSLFATAVPVISQNGRFVGALVVSGPVNRFDKEQKIIELLNAYKNKIIIP